MGQRSRAGPTKRHYCAHAEPAHGIPGPNYLNSDSWSCLSRLLVTWSTARCASLPNRFHICFVAESASFFSVFHVGMLRISSNQWWMKRALDGSRSKLLLNSCVLMYTLKKIGYTWKSTWHSLPFMFVSSFPIVKVISCISRENSISREDPYILVVGFECTSPS